MVHDVEADAVRILHSAGTAASHKIHRLQQILHHHQHRHEHAEVVPKEGKYE
jgi:hypothetical protein